MASVYGSADRRLAPPRRAPDLLAVVLRQEPVAHGEERCAGSVGDADLRVDVLDVIADRLGGNHQAGCDVLVRQAACGESEHVDLAVRETSDVDAAAGDAVAGCGEHRMYGFGVVASGSGVGHETVRCLV